jgi:leucyl/phenylalanyl-tRNA--protein transferase
MPVYRVLRSPLATLLPAAQTSAMTSRDDVLLEITPQVLLKAYAVGIFPMAESADDPGLYWIEPEVRGVIPLDGFHIPRRLARTIAASRFEIRIDSDFAGVIAGCAGATNGRPKTWINARIRKLYGQLFDEGACHTVEAWREGRLAGGLYGVTLGAAFFGESMFSVERDASKVALAYLVARLRAGGFRLLDTQFTTPHLKQFGAVDVDRRIYQEMLDEAIAGRADFYRLAGGVTSDVILQSVSQTS